MPNVKTSQPVYAEGLALVQDGDALVRLYYRKADGSLEASSAMTFLNNGGGVHFVYGQLSPGSAFFNDGHNRIHCDND